jgi:hypothetical protein
VEGEEEEDYTNYLKAFIDEIISFPLLGRLALRGLVVLVA